MVLEDKQGGQSCPICLEPVSGEAFLDQCFRRHLVLTLGTWRRIITDIFCYHCILQWSEMALSRPQSSSNRLQCLKCPLCKILAFRGSYSTASSLLERDAHVGNFEQQPSRFTDVVPKPNRWLSCWVERELQALMQDEDVETVSHHVVGVVAAFHKRFGGQRDCSANKGTTPNNLDWHATISTALRPFIFELAEKFAEELGLFLVSGLDIAAYDHRSQLAASTLGNLHPVKNADTVVFPNIYDLYDEDIGEDEVDLMVKGPSIEVERPPADESFEDMEYHSRKENTRVKSQQHSPREPTDKRRTKKRSKPSVESDEEFDRGRSRSRRDTRRKRKRSRLSRSRSPLQGKLRRTSKSTESGKRKRSKSTRTKHKKQASGSHHSLSKRRKLSETSSNSDTDSYRSSRNRRRGKRVAKVEVRKENMTTMRRAAARDFDGSRDDRDKLQSSDDEQEHNSNHCKHTTYGKSREKMVRIEDAELSDHGPVSALQQTTSKYEGREGATSVKNRVNVNDKPEISTAAGETARKTILLSSHVVRPDRSALELEPATGSLASSLAEVDATGTLRASSSYEHFHPARPSPYDHEDKAIEEKLREKALTNLMRHLNKKDAGASRQVAVAETSLLSTEVGRNADVFNPETSEQICSVRETKAVTASTANLPRKEESEGIGHGMPTINRERKTREISGPIEVVEEILTCTTHVAFGGNESSVDLLGNTCTDSTLTGLIGRARGRAGDPDLPDTEAGKSLEVTSCCCGADMMVTVPNEHMSLEGARIQVPLSKSDIVSSSDSLVAGSDIKFPEIGHFVKDGKILKLPVFKSSSCNSQKEVTVQQERESSLEISQGQLECKNPVYPSNLETSLGTGQVSPHSEPGPVGAEDGEGLAIPRPVSLEENHTGQCGSSCANLDSSADASYKRINSNEKEELSAAVPSQNVKGDWSSDYQKFQQKSMSVTRGGETVRVGYKVYIPPRAAAAAARRRLQR